MSLRLPRAVLLAVSALSSCCLGCGRLPGQPKIEGEYKPPDQVTSFEFLYGQNCSACHGTDGEGGPATDLANPVYQAFVSDNMLRNITANGQPGTLMPAFAKQSGGSLTEQQVQILVSGMRARWQKPFTTTHIPPYSAQQSANPERGENVYVQYCARCHGPVDSNPVSETHSSAGSILDGSFLALVSDQVIRTTIVAGRPDLGMPDWRDQIRGRPMSDEDIADVVAWISSHRPKFPGRSFPAETAETLPHGNVQAATRRAP